MQFWKRLEIELLARNTYEKCIFHGPQEFSKKMRTFQGFRVKTAILRAARIPDFGVANILRFPGFPPIPRFTLYALYKSRIV